MKNFKRNFTIILVVLLGLFTLFAYYGVYSTGYRSGTVIKVSKKGYVFKTHEGQLNIQTFGATSSGNMMSETFSFSVLSSDKELLSALKEVSLSGERVTLHYDEKYIKLPWRGDTKIFVKSLDRSTIPQQQDRTYPPRN